jgi:hypothetical protein
VANEINWTFDELYLGHWRNAFFQRKFDHHDKVLKCGVSVADKMQGTAKVTLYVFESWAHCIALQFRHINFNNSRRLNSSIALSSINLCHFVEWTESERIFYVDVLRNIVVYSTILLNFERKSARFLVCIIKLILLSNPRPSRWL